MSDAPGPTYADSAMLEIPAREPLPLSSSVSAVLGAPTTPVLNNDALTGPSVSSRLPVGLVSVVVPADPHSPRSSIPPDSPRIQFCHESVVAPAHVGRLPSSSTALATADNSALRALFDMDLIRAACLCNELGAPTRLRLWLRASWGPFTSLATSGVSWML